jgi:hypothetical protein
LARRALSRRPSLLADRSTPLPAGAFVNPRGDGNIGGNREERFVENQSKKLKYPTDKIELWWRELEIDEDNVTDGSCWQQTTQNKTEGKKKGKDERNVVGVAVLNQRECCVVAL